MNRYRLSVLVAAWMLVVPSVHAQMAVVDLQAIVQAVKEMAVLKDQLTAARNQLTQAQQQFQALTGARGMERLLSGAARNYLPSEWADFEAALRGVQSSYGALTSQLDAVIHGNAVLTDQQLSRLAPDQQQQLTAARRSVALLQVTSRDALQASSQRFTDLQQLIDAIPRATDTKAALDLQARIGAEQAMLQNESTKLMVLHQAAQAEQEANAQRARELAIANLGSLRQLPAMGLHE